MHAPAVQVSNLYSATVSVGSQQVSARDAAFNEALKRVLVKVSGQAALLEDTELLSAILPAQRYVQTFSYRENPEFAAYQRYREEQALVDTPVDEPVANKNAFADPDVPLAEQDVAEAFAQVPEPFLVDVTFSKSLIDNRLAEWQVPIWGAIRPSVLAWVVLSEEGERQVVGSAHALAQDLRDQAEELALPVFLPVMDLEDVGAVNHDDLWGLFPDAIADAAARYRPDSNLLVRVSQSSNGLWSARWSLLLKREVISAELQDVTLNALWHTVLSFVGTQFSQRYAVLVSEQEAGALTLNVDGVDAFGDYVALRTYLRALPPVASAEPSALDRRSVTYRVRLNGSEQQFLEFLELGGKLRPIVSPEPLVNDFELYFGDGPIEGGLPDSALAIPVEAGASVMRLEWLGGR